MNQKKNKKIRLSIPGINVFHLQLVQKVLIL